MEEVLDIYKQAYDPKHPVICMDESSKQLIKETRQSLPMKSGDVKKFDTEYERNGTASIFMAFEPLQGLRFTKITEQRTRTDWAYYIREIIDLSKTMRVESMISFGYPDEEKSPVPKEQLDYHKIISMG